MNLYEMLLTETRTVKIRVRANSQNEADKIYKEFEEKESEYICEELDINGTSEWLYSEFKKVDPAPWDEAATITKNPDGSFDAIYEGGDPHE